MTIPEIEFEFSVCTHCESKMDEHYKICAECGNPVNDNFKEVVLDVVSFENIKEKVNSLILKFIGRLDKHIYQARLLNKRAYEPWTNEEDKLLIDCCNNSSSSELSDLFGRSIGGVKSRLKELNVDF